MGSGLKQWAGEFATGAMPGFAGTPIRWLLRDKDEEEVVESKKEQTIHQHETVDIDISQREYAFQQEIQAPLSYAPSISKVYSPSFTVHSPGAVTGATVESKSAVEFSQILTALQKLAQSQSADTDVSQKQDAEQAMKEVAGLDTTKILILACVGVAGYGLYKYGKEPAKKAIKKDPRIKAAIKAKETVGGGK